MQTHFSLVQLADPKIAESNQILRACVHCGFCLATCPTYQILGDELDSPRGRIYLIKNMLEAEAPADAVTVKHLDRCLTCLSCMTTCPSSVHYMHLIDNARTHVAKTYRRPAFEALTRSVLNAVLPSTSRFRAATALAGFAKPFASLLPKTWRAMLMLLPKTTPQMVPVRAISPPSGLRKGRVALLDGCVQPVLRLQINQAAIRLLNRLGIEVITPPKSGCCGALSHHLAKEESARQFAKANIDAWTTEIEQGLDAIIVTASGCGTMIKDYGHMFRGDANYAAKAARVSLLAMDISEYLARIGLDEPRSVQTISVAYHSACSMQHGQKISAEPRALLRACGYDVREIADGHLCCGSAGVYNILEPELAEGLRDRKLDNIEKTGAALVATGNIGCIAQLQKGTRLPIVHTVELLDWATGGPAPAEISSAS